MARQSCPLQYSNNACNFSFVVTSTSYLAIIALLVWAKPKRHQRNVALPWSTRESLENKPQSSIILRNHAVNRCTLLILLPRCTSCKNNCLMMSFFSGLWSSFNYFAAHFTVWLLFAVLHSRSHWMLGAVHIWAVHQSNIETTLCTLTHVYVFGSHTGNRILKAVCWLSGPGCHCEKYCTYTLHIFDRSIDC